MSRRKLFISLLLPLLSVAPAWTQSAHYSVPAVSVEDRFAAYRQALSGAADELLAEAGTAEQAPEATSSASAVNASPAEEGALRRFAQQYWDGHEQDLGRAVERVAQLRPALEPILHQEGVPTDVVALVLVESGGRATALSPKGALGLWQLMPETARRYGLTVSPQQDQRMDVVKSTYAAAHYLHDLYSEFGNWALAIAAYNAGEQAVQRAIAQNGNRDFETISRSRRLPLETRNYVPAVLSAVRLLGGALPTRVGQRPRISSAQVFYADAALVK